MIAYCADDSPSHLSNIKAAVEHAFEIDGVDAEVRTFRDGDELIASLGSERPVLVTLDLNMPTLDGLSTLVKLRQKYHRTKILIVSSENEIIVRRHAKTRHFDADDAKKIEMLDRVVARVANNAPEEGKINSVLEACGSLGLDPITISKRLGASGFLSKPFDYESASQHIAEMLSCALAS